MPYEHTYFVICRMLKDQIIKFNLINDKNPISQTLRHLSKLYKVLKGIFLASSF